MAIPFTSQVVEIMVPTANLMEHRAKLFTWISHLTLPTGEEEDLKRAL